MARGNRMRLRLDGVGAFALSLERMPEEIQPDAREIVWSTGANAAQEIREAYPKGPGRPSRGYAGGNLKRGVHVAFSEDRLHVRAVVTNTAPHAHFFEYGTQERHTREGFDRGRMPPGHVFIPTMMRHRRMMELKLLELVGRYLRVQQVA